MTNLKQSIVWFFLDIGNPWSLTRGGKLVYRVSKWLSQYADKDYAEE